MCDVEKTRRGFKPDSITTLFVGESAPAGGTFFYDREKPSKLFEAMKRVFNGDAHLLDNFKKNGFYLDDLVDEPVNKTDRKLRRKRRKESIPLLARRMKCYKPKAVVIVMCAIRPMVLQAMHEAELSYEPYCVPFPAFGNQTRFHEEMKRIIPKLPVTNGTKWKDYYQ